MDEGLHPPFPEEGWPRNSRELPSNFHSGQDLQWSVRNRIEPEFEKILRKNQNGFRRNRSKTSQILTIRWNLEGVCAKNLETTLLFVTFFWAFDSIHRGKMEKILLEYGRPKINPCSHNDAIWKHESKSPLRMETQIISAL